MVEGDRGLMPLKHLIGYAQWPINRESMEDSDCDSIAFERFVYSALGEKKSGKSF